MKLAKLALQPVTINSQFSIKKSTDVLSMDFSTFYNRLLLRPNVDVAIIVFHRELRPTAVD